MNLDQQPEHQHAEPEAEPQGAAIQQPAPENPLSKFDASTLKGIGASAMIDPGIVAFLPQNMAEAMEFAKVMSQGNFVAPHLRGKPGDCLAIVIMASRWGADPFAVANKSYFVNSRMAFEAQLVNAVVNSSGVLNGRLQVSWQGAGPTLQCTVRGQIKGDREVHELIQESGTITTKNSPLWKQAEKVQLAYYTTRAWARLYTPEVLLGIYTPDELEEIDNRDHPGAQTVIPPRPTRESVKAEREAAERMRQEQDANAEHARSISRETDHDPETGEVVENEDSQPQTQARDGTNNAETGPDEGAGDTMSGPRADSPPPGAASQGQGAEPSHQKSATTLVDKIKKVGTPRGLNAILSDYAQDLDLLRTDAPDIYKTVTDEIDAKKKWFAR